MAESLRDQLAANYDKIVTVPDAPAEVATDIPADPPSSRIQEAPRHDAKAKATPAKETDSVSDRPRDETGKFVKVDEKAAKKDEGTAAVIHQTKATTPGTPQSENALAAQPPAKPRPQRPSSWKKEYWDQWDKLDPSLAEYIHQRESEYAKGVSTYKHEWDRAKPLLDAMEQFRPELEQHRIQPHEWISNLGNAHRMLALGTPQQKLQMFSKLAQDYGIPLQVFGDQGVQQQYLAQGQFQQPYQPPVPPQQQPLTQEQAMKLFQEQFLQVNSEQELQRFAADTAKHPHYEEVRNTMAQLLEANLANDLESAYEAALRLPAHAHLYEAAQQQERQAQEEARRRAEAERVQKAKAKAVSMPSATPSGPTDEKPKGLRSNIEAAYEQHAAGARV